MQKRASAGFSTPQLGHVTTVGVYGVTNRHPSPSVLPGKGSEILDMMRTRSIVLAAAVAGAAMTLAACSNSSSGGAYGAAGSTSTSTVAAGTAATVATADVGQLGTVLVDGTGRTLYLFTNDTGTSSTCSGDCAATWPALTTKGDAAVGTGAKSQTPG